MPEGVHRLVVISHVVHYRSAGQLYAYGPYAREIDVWADLFPQVAIAAPCRDELPPGDNVPFTRPNISIRPQKETGGETLQAKLWQCLNLPALVWGLGLAMRDADAIHVRCPGNLGLLGALLAPLFSRHLVAKYAGQWNGYAGEPWTVRLQRWLLRSPWWRGPVTVYGVWPDQPTHIVPFFTSMMTTRQVDRACEIASQKQIGSPLRVIYSGRLTRAKRVATLVDAMKIAIDRGLALDLVIVGDGPERPRLESQIIRLGLKDRVRFMGGLRFDRALDWLEWADCLVLPSHSEGWPKVIAEGMCHGLVCIAVEHGQVPTMLTGRGILLKSGAAEEIADALQQIGERTEHYQSIARAGVAWARQHSLEGLREALRELLAERWYLPSLCSSPTMLQTPNRS